MIKEISSKHLAKRNGKRMKLREIYLLINNNYNRIESSISI